MSLVLRMPSEKQVPAFLVHTDSTYDSICVLLCISLETKSYFLYLSKLWQESW